MTRKRHWRDLFAIEGTTYTRRFTW